MQADSREFQQSEDCEGHLQVNTALEGSHRISQDEGPLACQEAAETQELEQHYALHQYRKAVYGHVRDEGFTMRVTAILDDD